MGLLLVLIAIVVFRKLLLAYAIESYFANNGAQSLVEVLAFDGSGASLKLSLGTHEEFAAQRIDVHFDPNYLVPHVDSVDVSEPVARLTFDGRTVSFGSLEALIDSLKKARPRSWTDDYVKTPLPVSLRDANAVIATPAGPITLAGTMQFSGSQVLRADLHAVPTILHWRTGSLHLERASLGGRSTDQGFEASALVDADGAGYDSAGRDIPLRVHAALDLRDTVWNPSGTTVLVVPNFLLLADVQADKNSAHIAARGGVHWHSDEIGSVDIHIDGKGGIDPERARTTLRLLPVVGGDPAIVKAFAGAANAFQLATDIHFGHAPGHTALTLITPLTLRSQSGATIIASQASQMLPWLSFDGASVTGGMALRVVGGGLPDADLTLSNYTLSNVLQAGRVIDATLHTTLAISTRMFKGAAIAGSAHVTGQNNTLGLTLNGCADARIGALILKEKKYVTSARARLCPQHGRSLFQSDETGWHFTADLVDAGATFPAAQAMLHNAAGNIAMAGTSDGRATGDALLSRGALTDLLKGTRFVPISVSGRAMLENGAWHGTGSMSSTRHPTKLGTVTFFHRLSDGKGRAVITARGIRFDPNALAPSDLSPLLSSIARADGTANFQGQIAWDRGAITSSGELDVDGLKFASPLGGAQNTSTHIKFISLLPPETAQNQTLGIDRIDWVSPMTAVGAHFHFSTKVIDLSGMTADVAGGTIRIDPLTITVGATQTISGTLRISQIDLGQLLAQSNLSSKVHAQAILSGTIPFSISNEGIRIKDGYVAAAKPGRISIERTLWTSGTISSNAMQDFAYQAMENLAFDRLQGKINSLPQGRLGLVLHIEGRNDPPNAAEARVGLFDLLRGQAFSKPVQLPKGTPIDLTLDTSLNFDELLRAYRAARSPEIGE